MNEQKILLQLLKGIDIDVSGVNHSELIKLSYKHKVFPIVYDKIKDKINSSEKMIYDYVYENWMSKLSKLLYYSKKISERVENAGLEVILPKGIAIGKLIYCDEKIRMHSDVDFLVHNEDVDFVADIMMQEGMYHRYNENFRSVSKSLCCGEFDNLYEIKFYLEDRCYELKIATDAVDKRFIQDFMNHIQRVEIEGGYIKTFDMIHSLLHLCANAFKDTYEFEGIFSDNQKIRNFYDIYKFIYKYKSQIQWDSFIHYAEKYEMEKKVALIINKTFELFEDKVNLENQMQEWVEFNAEKMKNEIKHCSNAIQECLFENEKIKKEYVEALWDKWINADENFMTESILGEWYSVATNRLKWNGEKIQFDYSFRIVEDELICKINLNPRIVEQLADIRLYIYVLKKSTDETRGLYNVESIGRENNAVLLTKINGEMVYKNCQNINVWKVNWRTTYPEQVDYDGKMEIVTKGEQLYGLLKIAKVAEFHNTPILYNMIFDGFVTNGHYLHIGRLFGEIDKIGYLKGNES